MKRYKYEREKMKPSILCITLISMLLSACGQGSGDEQGSVTEPSPPDVAATTIEAHPISEHSKIGAVSTIDLDDYVVASNDYELTSIQIMGGENQECQIVSQKTHSFQVTSGSLTQCDFMYQVMDKDNSSVAAEAIARVSFSHTYSDEVIQPISAVTDIDTPVQIDLSSQLPEGYTLSSEAALMGPGDYQVHTATNKITYTPTGDINDVGVVRLLASASNGINIASITIDISISNTIGNQAPIAENFTYSGSNSEVNIDEEITIDVSDYISDPDGDELVLLSVDTYNASANIVNPDDPTDTRFTFIAQDGGNNYVSYTISDNKGGYATGIVEIVVEANFDNIQDWQDIPLYDPTIDTDITFLAPMSKKFADYVNVNYTSVYVEDGTQGPLNASVATMTYEQAEHYCRSRDARLPTTRELDLLAQVEGGVYSTHNWPASLSYWSYNKLSQHSANTKQLLTGADIEISSESEIPEETAAYTTCVALDNEKIKDFVIRDFMTEQSSENQYNTKITLDLIDPEGQPAAFQKVKLESLASEAGFGYDNTSATDYSYTDENGTLNVDYFFTVTDYDILGASFSINLEPEIKKVSIPEVGFSANDPELWNYSLVNRKDDTFTLDDFEPVVSEKGALIIPYGGDNNLAGIAEQWIQGDNVEVTFKIDKVGELKGQVNVILQQVSPIIPNVYDENDPSNPNESCNPEDYGGTCQWYEYDLAPSEAGYTAGVPLEDNRWINFGFNVADNEMKMSYGEAYDPDSEDHDYNIYYADAVSDPHGQKETSYYKIKISNNTVEMYSSADGESYGEPLIAASLDSLQINTDHFYWFELSGGTAYEEVEHYVNELEVTYY